MGTYNTYTEEQQDFLRSNSPFMSKKELTNIFNEKFHTKKGYLAIKSYCNSRGWKSGNDGKFKKGMKPWAKGMNKEAFVKHYTPESFKRMTHNATETNKTKKIGDEIVIDGVPFVIMSTDYSAPYWKRRVPKRRVVWEQVHGEVPKGYCIINLDRNQMNCEIENLYCMPIKFRTVIAKNKWWSTNPQATLAAIKWCEHFYALKEIVRNCRE